MTTSRNISWHKRKKETAGNNPAVSNFCVMDARLLCGVLSKVAGRVFSGVFPDDGSIFKAVLNTFVGSVGVFDQLFTASGEGTQTRTNSHKTKFIPTLMH